MRGRHRSGSGLRRPGAQLVCAALGLVLTVSTLLVPPRAVTPTAQAASPVQRAVSTGAAEAAQRGVTTYATVIDRSSGAVLGRTGNAGTQVASESEVKLLLAAYYLVRHHGNLPASLDQRLRYMIKYSDDSTASRLWSDSAVPAMRARYKLPGIGPATPYAGYWGRTKVSADGLATFLYRAGKDPLVGPWLFAAMRSTADHGSDGYNQNLGFNRIPGAGSKQGWGADNWVNGAYAVHSAGVTGRYVAVVLQSGGSGTYDVMPRTASRTAGLIDAAASSVRRPTTVHLVPSTTVALAKRRMTLTATVTTRLGRAVPGRKVRLYQKAEHGGWHYHSVLISDRHGKATFHVSTGRQGHRWKAVVPAGSGYVGAEAGTTVYVRRAITGVQNLPDRATRNRVLVAVGHTGRGYVGRVIRIQHITSRGWVSDGASIVEADGSYKIYFRAAGKRDARYYRAYIAYRSGSYQALTWSGVHLVVVR